MAPTLCTILPRARPWRTRLSKGSSGATVENETIEGITRDLVALVAKIKASSAPASINNSFWDLAEQCQSIAEDLLNVLENIKAKSPNKRWKSLLQAIHASWKKEYIDGMFKRLERLRDQLLFHLQIILSIQRPDRQSALVELIRDAKAESEVRGQHLESSVKSLQDSISRIERSMKQNALHPPETKDELLATSLEAMLLFDREDVSGQISYFVNFVKSSKSDELLLESLWFETIENRRSQVTPAHNSTFSWALTPMSNTQLESWLKQGDGIYWIRGKAGSGKSTFMKYLIENEGVLKACRHWAKDKKLVTANFFFWNAGTDLQKSLEGLLRSLLHEIFQQCPGLISTVCKFKLPKFRTASVTWTLQDLWRVTTNLLEHDNVNTKFCFFIDGLDEYDGDPDDVIESLERLRKWSHIKLCISSRPWNEFIDAYGQPHDLFSTLEQLTQADIKNYVAHTLECNMRFKSLKERDFGCQILVNEIVEKAHGVFLWVRLVVHSLLSGLRNADRICDLQRRLEAFPETLESFFNHMLQSVEPFYRTQMAKTFMVALSIEDVPTFLTLSFLDEDYHSSELTNNVQALRLEQILEIRDDMERRLNSRCKGLLEIVRRRIPDDLNTYCLQFFEHEVHFIHRTARDFLLSKYAQSLLGTHLDENFDAYLCTSKAVLAELRSFDYELNWGHSRQLRGKLQKLIKASLQAKSQTDANAVLMNARILSARRSTNFDELNMDRGMLDFFIWEGALDCVKQTFVLDPVLARSEGHRLLSPVSINADQCTSQRADLIETMMASGLSVEERLKEWERFVQMVCQPGYIKDEGVRNILRPILSRVSDTGVYLIPNRRR